MSVYNRKGRPVFGHLIVRINSKLVKLCRVRGVLIIHCALKLLSVR